jgi:hypothetical protein
MKKWHFLDSLKEIPLLYLAGFYPVAYPSYIPQQALLGRFCGAAFEHHKCNHR